MGHSCFSAIPPPVLRRVIGSASERSGRTRVGPKPYREVPITWPWIALYRMSRAAISCPSQVLPVQPERCAVAAQSRRGSFGCDLLDRRAPRPPHGGLFQRRRLTCVSTETALPYLVLRQPSICGFGGRLGRASLLASRCSEARCCMGAAQREPRPPGETRTFKVDGALDRYANSRVRRNLCHWSQGGSNPRPSACHADALPTAPWPLGFFMSHYLRIGPIWQGGFRTLPSRTQICQGRAITASRADDEPRILPRWCGFGHKILSRRSPRHGGFKGQSRLFGSGSCR